MGEWRRGGAMEIVYKENQLGTFSVGFVDQDGEWITVSKHQTAEIAADHVRQDKGRLQKLLDLQRSYWKAEGSVTEQCDAVECEAIADSLNNDPKSN